MTRVPDSTVRRHLLANIQRNASSLARRRIEIASGRRVQRSSDDISAASRGMSAASGIRRAEGFARATESTSLLAGSMESAIGALMELLTEARANAARAGNDGPGSENGDEALAQAVDGLLEEALVLANRRALGDHVFGGEASDAPPYVATRDASGRITAVTPSAGIDEPVTRLVGEEPVEVPITGPGVFEDGGDLFGALIGLRDSILADDGQGVTDAAAIIDSIESHVVDRQAALGSFTRRVDAARNRLETSAIDLERERSRALDTDMAEAMVRLTSEEFFYQSALQVSARISHLSLMSFL